MPYGIGGFYFDPMYFVFLVPAILLAMYAQWRVQSAYSRWSLVRNNRNLTGVDVAKALLPNERMSDVRVEMVAGKLSDHYDPANNILRLSSEVAQQPTIAAMAIAAHEIGHAEQDRDNYFLMKLRSGIVPFVNIGSQLGYLIFFGGLFAQIPAIAWIGVLMFSAGAIFALVTLPVELDASSRALRMLNDNQLIQSGEEYAAAKNMLSAAALTYVAGAAQAVLTVLYYVFVLLNATSRNRQRE
jgi:Zn-dependent membrane protease YugP